MQYLEKRAETSPEGQHDTPRFCRSARPTAAAPGAEQSCPQGAPTPGLRASARRARAHGELPTGFLVPHSPGKAGLPHPGCQRPPTGFPSGPGQYRDSIPQPRRLPLRPWSLEASALPPGPEEGAPRGGHPSSSEPPPRPRSVPCGPVPSCRIGLLPPERSPPREQGDSYPPPASRCAPVPGAGSQAEQKGARGRKRSLVPGSAAWFPEAT